MNPAAAALELRDIHAPPPPPFWPPAPGWWLLAALLFILLVLGGRALWRYSARRRQQRRILAELDQLTEQTDSDTAGFTTALSTLLRRVALMRYPRRDVAALSGDAWLRFLDETGGNGAFTRGPGRLLATAPYTARVEQPVDPALTDLARRWIQHTLKVRP